MRCTSAKTTPKPPKFAKHAYLTISQDPRQYVPPQGQTWTSHAHLATNHANKWQTLDDDPNLWSLWTEPKFAIGQRAVLLKTPHGNVLWDCIALLDERTIDFIKGQGGLAAIVISHPHYYTTHLRWAQAFECPVYISAEDAGWTQRRADDSGQARRELLKQPTTEIVPGVTAIKTGGHFPGSLVLHCASRLFVADTLVTVPSALYHRDRPPGTTSYAFMWSIPNMIPLPPGEMRGMWRALEPWEFSSTHGAFVGTEVRDKDGGGRVKERVRESMRIQAGGEGWLKTLGEGWP